MVEGTGPVLPPASDRPSPCKDQWIVHAETALEVIREAAAAACAVGAAEGTTIGGTADAGTAEACAACVAAAAAGPPPKPPPSPPRSCHLRKGAPPPASPPSPQVTPAGCRCRRACATMRGGRHPALILAVEPEKKRALRTAASRVGIDTCC